MKTAARMTAMNGRADSGARSSSGGATRWSLPEEFGGESCPRPLLVQRYAQLAGGSLTAVFILSQHDAAVRRLVAAPANANRRSLASRHRCTAVPSRPWGSRISRRRGGWALSRSRCRGRTAGVIDSTGRSRGSRPPTSADVFVTGAALDDGRQMLIALPADRPGVVVRPPFPLAALQASCTSQVVLEGVEVDDSDLLAGPALDIMSQPGAVGTAGLETSALALGRRGRPWRRWSSWRRIGLDLAEPLEVLCENWQTLWGQLMAQARGDAGCRIPRRDPHAGQRPGPPLDPGLSDGAQGNRLPPDRARPALGAPGPFLPGLVMPGARRPGRHSRPGRLVPGVKLEAAGTSRSC